MDDKYFWPRVISALKTAMPLVDMLRMVDSEKEPAMSYIYGVMDSTKELIAKKLGGENLPTRKFERLLMTNRTSNCTKICMLLPTI